MDIQTTRNRSNINVKFYNPTKLISDNFHLFKGYLHYKTITSQNVSSEVQIKDFFISYKNYIPFSRYSSFCVFNHPVIYRICDVMMSISI